MALCRICVKRPREKGGYCTLCQRTYNQLYREYLRQNPDDTVNQRPCVKCTERPRMPGQRWCNQCDRAYRNANSKRRTAMMSPLARKKEAVRAKTRRLIKKGVLVKQPCESTIRFGRPCGDENVQVHHPDYDQPTLVMWVCRACHRAEHDHRI